MLTQVIIIQSLAFLFRAFNSLAVGEIEIFKLLTDFFAGFYFLLLQMLYPVLEFLNFFVARKKLIVLVFGRIIEGLNRVER